MNTITFISNSIKEMQKLQVPATITIGTITVESRGCLHNWAGRNGNYESSSIKFRLNFRPDHIQNLLDMGVTIDFNTVKMSGLSENAKRFKAGRAAIKQGRYAPYYYMGNPDNAITGVIENWLDADATCSPSTLDALDKFCRDNHRNEIAIHNDTVLSGSGWKFKPHYQSNIDISSQYFNIKAIRKTAIGKPACKLLPIQKRVLNLF